MGVSDGALAPPRLATISVSSINVERVTEVCYWKVLGGFVEGPLGDLEALAEWALEHDRNLQPLIRLASLLAQSDDAATLERCAGLCSRGMGVATARSERKLLAAVSANCQARLSAAQAPRQAMPLDAAVWRHADDLASFEILLFCDAGSAESDLERWLAIASVPDAALSIVVGGMLGAPLEAEAWGRWLRERVPTSVTILVGTGEVPALLARSRRPNALLVRPEQILHGDLITEARQRFARGDGQSFLQYFEIPVDARGQYRIGADAAMERVAAGGLFARVAQLRRIGFLDDLFYATGFVELVERARQVLGRNAVDTLDAPAMLRHEPLGSLAELPIKARVDSATLRRFWQVWHARGDGLCLDASQPRSAAAPLGGMRPRRGRFDVIVGSEYRLAGGGPHSCMCEIRALAAAGLRVGILQLDAVTYSNYRNFDRNFAHDVVKEGVAEPVVHPDQAHCDLLIVRYPAVFAERCLKGFPIEADDVRIVVNAPPVRHEGGDEFYSVAACVPVIRERTGCDATWHPVGPDARAAMMPYAGIISLAEEDWPAVVEMDVFSGGRRHSSDRGPIIGRHGRDHWTKWPGTREDLAAAYAVDRDGVKVRILGGAKRAIEVLGRQPRNWEVLAYGEMPAVEFLRGIDFFVYFPNETRIEPFARSILEALAAGVVVILPERYREIYGEAAVYCEPDQVVPVAQWLFEAPDAYAEQRVRGLTFVRARHGPDGFARFVRDIIASRNRARPACRPGHEIRVPQSGQP